MTARLSPSPAVPHGGTSRAGIDLSASLNPLGPSPLALAAARKAELTRYPEVDARTLAHAAATRHAIPAEAIVAVPGASWGLWFCLVAHAMPGRRCIALAPCFGEYRRVAEVAGFAYTEVRNGLHAALQQRPDVVLLGNPENPTGKALSAHEIRALCSAHAGALFIVDEAFAAFAPSGTSLVDGQLPPRNAIVVRSLTKELGLPGLRMGYLVASPERAAQLQQMLPAWPLSAPALAAGVAGCADSQHIDMGALVARRHVHAMCSALSDIGARVSRSCANYVCCSAPDLLQRLATRGIAARDCTSFGMPDHLRLAAPAPADLPAVLEAIHG